MKVYTFFIILLVLLFAVNTSSQARDFYNDIIKKNLQVSKYALDTEASAVILFEKESVLITHENNKYLQKKIVHRIIKVLKSDATSLGNVHILYPKDDYQNYVNNIKGIVYNLSGNDTVTASISSQDLYKKRVYRNRYEMSFSLPSVKEGSIIDYSFEVNEEFNTELYIWEIQESYPKLISEYNFDFPGGVQFTAVSHVKERQKEFRTEEDAEEATDGFCIVKNASSFYNNFFWIRRNVPGLKTEPYVNNVKVYFERMELQLTSIATRYGAIKLSNSWDKLNDDFWEKFHWRELLSKRNKFLDNVVDSLVKIDTSKLGKCRVIFSYVRDHFKCNKEPFDVNIDLADVFTSYEGNQREITFLLTAMLIHAGLDASPVMLSTTDRVPMTSVFPVLGRINYMACAVKIDSGFVFLDASNKNNAFGRLPLNCYNGFAWILGHPGTGINLTPKVIKDRNLFGVKISDFTDSTAKVEITEKYGLILSTILRKQWDKEDEAQKKYISNQEAKLPLNMQVLSSKVENINNPDTNIVIKYSCKWTFEKNAGTLVFNSNLISPFTENPFKETVRQLPVEFPYGSENIYVMSLLLPDNMEIDSIFEPVAIDFENGDITYKKTMTKYTGTNMLTLNASFAINNIAYDTSIYETLRQFFGAIIDEGNRVITIKRK